LHGKRVLSLADISGRVSGPLRGAYQAALDENRSMTGPITKKTITIYDFAAPMLRGKALEFLQ
jgi:hypothetical protein